KEARGDIAAHRACRFGPGPWANALLWDDFPEGRDEVLQRRPPLESPRAWIIDPQHDCAERSSIPATRMEFSGTTGVSENLSTSARQISTLEKRYLDRISSGNICERVGNHVELKAA